MKCKERGFTLIELMLIVAIIGLLAYISVAKFSELMTKAKQSATKGHLGVLRSGLKIYYGDNDGNWPVTLADLISTVGDRGYINVIPESELVIHPTTNDEYAGTSVDESGGKGGRWLYNNTIGNVNVNCTHTDMKGEVISTW